MHSRTLAVLHLFDIIKSMAHKALKFCMAAWTLLSLLCGGSIADTRKPLVLGIHPYLPSTELVQRFTPLAGYLSRRTGKPVIIEVAKDYEEQIDRIGNNKIDIAFMGPVSYVKMVGKYGKKPILARLEVNGKPTFRGAVVTARESRIKSLRDLKGKRFAFVEPNSTMGHLVPRYLLLQEGMDVTELDSYKFLYNHHNVALSVLAGDFDAGAVKEDVFYEYERRGLRLLAWTPPISEHVFVASPLLPGKTIRDLRSALLGLDRDEEGGAIMSAIQENLTGIVEAADGNYENLRLILEALKRFGVEP